MSHTPAPWRISYASGDESGRPLFMRIWPDGEFLGVIAYIAEAEHIGGITWAEAEANARLIAASPLMLEALRACMAPLGRAGYEREREQVRAAIAAALGEQS